MARGHRRRQYSSPCARNACESDESGRDGITIDRTALELVAGSKKVETVTITNHLSGVVNLEIGADRPKGLVVGIDKPILARDEKAVVSFGVAGDARPSGTVRISAGPIQDFLIQIRTK